MAIKADETQRVMSRVRMLEILLTQDQHNPGGPALSQDMRHQMKIWINTGREMLCWKEPLSYEAYKTEAERRCWEIRNDTYGRKAS